MNVIGLAVCVIGVAAVIKWRIAGPWGFLFGLGVGMFLSRVVTAILP